MREYEPYHIHSYLTNMRVPDSVVSKEQYATRFAEIGTIHTLSTCEHAFQGDIYYANDVCDRLKENGYDIRPVQVCETYFVKDRLEQDSKNAHLILAAVNDDGRKEMNAILSEANITGFYHRPRVDLSLLMSVNPRNMIVTTACVGGIWKYSEAMEYLQIAHTLKSHFGKNFFLEIQAHETPEQKRINEIILGMYKKGYQIIAGTDSHYIDKENEKWRTLYLESKGIRYPEEEGWDLSLPEADELYQKFVKQGVFSGAQIEEAIRNTLIFRTCNNPAFKTEYDLNKNKKVPNPRKDLTPSERVIACKRTMLANYRKMYPNVTPEEEARDFFELKYESKTIGEEIEKGIPSADYFLLMSDIVKEGVLNGGTLTTSGRGSMVGFFSNHLLGLTSVNRVTAPVKMYADRFISHDRIVSGQIPDADLNISDQVPFVKGAQKILGEWGALPMIAYGKMQIPAAWKMYARANGIPADISDAVSKGIQVYEKALRYAKEEYEEDESVDSDETNTFGINLEDYIPKEYIQLVIESRIYTGVIDSYSPHPCAHLLLDGDIRSEIGIIRLKGAGGATQYAALIDGATADKYGYLKADFLFVDVVKIIKNTFDSIGMNIPTENELLKMVDGDKPTWDMYAKGYTMGINQCEKQATKEKAMKYKPKNVVELSAFIAAVRPGFKSMLDTFLSRSKFEYGIPILDKMVQTDVIPSSFIIYQEQIMQVLQGAGISASESYDCIKAISKKKAKVINSFKDRFFDGFSKAVMSSDGTSEEDALLTAEKVWTIIEDSAQYLFNGSHAYCMALDSLYGAWLKAHHTYEFYISLLRNYSERGDKGRIALLKNEMESAFSIKISPIKFGNDNRSYVANKSESTIMDALTSLKYMGSATAASLYEVSQGQTEDFVDVLVECEHAPAINKRQIGILIMARYFDKFGTIGNLIEIHKAFSEGSIAYKKTYVQKTRDARIAALKEFAKSVNRQDPSPAEMVSFEIEYFGLPVSLWPDSRNVYAAVEVDDKYTPRILMSNLSTGATGAMKIRKNVFARNIVSKGDIIEIIDWHETSPFRTKEGYSVSGGKWLDEYAVYGKDNQDGFERLFKKMGNVA